MIENGVESVADALSTLFRKAPLEARQEDSYWHAIQALFAGYAGVRI
jgi:hypothetical protein